MTMRFLTKLLKTLVTVLSLSYSIQTLGNSCMPLTLDEQIDLVDTVVFAVLVEAHIVDQSFVTASATFRVHEVLKGTVDDEFVVSTSANSGNGGGIDLLIGAHYLLFFNSDRMRIGVCSGSGRASVAQVAEVRQRLQAW